MSSNSQPFPIQNSSPINGEQDLQRLVREQQETIREQQETIREQQETIREQQETIRELRQTIATIGRQLTQQQERIEQLETELKTRKKLNKRPKITASRLNDSKSTDKEKSKQKRPGSAKVSKKNSFQIDEERIIQPEKVPRGATFHGYRDYDVQELLIERHNIRFRLAEYVTEDGSTVVGQLPREYQNGHFGPLLLGYILYQHYQCRVPQPIVREQLQEWGIEISTGQLHNILSENKESFHTEQERVLRVGLETATYIHTDDTGARHQGKNGYCTVIGNQYFAYFRSTHSKSRQTFLETLHGGSPLYVLNEEAQGYLQESALASKHWQRLSFGNQVLAKKNSEWESYLNCLGIISQKARRLVTEAALLGGVIEKGVDINLRILSDGAGQFNLLVHGLCWVHAERSLRRLQGNTSEQCQNIDSMQQLLWDYYQQLKAYQQDPSPEFKAQLEQDFDQVFGRCFLEHSSLNDVLAQFRGRKEELLQVLDCPELPLHNNEAESDIREYVTRRKISGGSRSETGRKSRDTFVGLKKTCRKLGISFWKFLLSRLRGDETIPPIPDVIARVASGIGTANPI
jgi:hypothetical protein